MISTRKNDDKSNAAKPYNFRFLALYIGHGGDDGSKVLHTWTAGCNCDKFDQAMYEIEATQEQNYRAKEKTYHLVVSFRPEDEAKLTLEVLQDIERHFAAALGFTDHQRVCGVHVDTDNMHMHIAYNKIHPEKLTSLTPYQDFPKRDAVCRAMEQKYGLQVDSGKDVHESDKSKGKAAAMEAMQGLESLETYVKNRKEAILEKLAVATHWPEVHAVLALYGLEIKPRANGFTIKDKYSRHMVKASSVDRSLSKKHLESRFGKYEPPVADMEYIEEERYKPAPIQSKSPERDLLFEFYSEKIERRRSRLEEIKTDTQAKIKAAEAHYNRLCNELIFSQMLAAERRRLTRMFRLEQKQEISTLRAAAANARESLKQEIPFHNWNEFLQQEAANGNATALKILRNKTVAPDKSREFENRSLVWETKNALLDDIRAEQLDVLNIKGVTAKDRNKLMQELKLKEYAVYNNEFEQLLKLPYEVDYKGTVIFTLPNGGKVRDDGQAVHFSAHDPDAVNLKILMDHLENISINGNNAHDDVGENLPLVHDEQELS